MYSDYDITIYYDRADVHQLARLKKYVRCKKRRKGELVKCKKAFFNYDIDMIDEVEAEEYIFVTHGIFQILGKVPPITHPKLNRWIGVSQYACDMIEEYAVKLGRPDIKAELFYNPLTLEPKEKVLRIVTASRLEDKVKGGDRILTFIDALDRYCRLHNRHYIFEIFSDSQKEIESKNVVKLKPRVDVRPYIADADWLVQLSDDMETYCYSFNEALCYHTRIVTTPLTVCKELNIPKEAHFICEWDMSNVDEVVQKMFEETEKQWSYLPPKARYEDILDLTKSNYKEERKMKIRVKATNKYELNGLWDTVLSEQLGKRTIPFEGQEWDVDVDRAEQMVADGMGIIVDTPKEELAEEITEPITQDEIEIIEADIENTVADLEKMTNKELLQMAKDLGLKLSPKTTKPNIISKILEKQNS